MYTIGKKNIQESGLEKKITSLIQTYTVGNIQYQNLELNIKLLILDKLMVKFNNLELKKLLYLN